MKQIINYPNYKLDEDGNIYRLNNKIKVYSINNKGYKRITLSKNGIKKSFLIHRLVAIHFILNPLNLPQVNHKDGIKTNNNVNNLEWSTASDNIKHSFKNNLSNCKGEKNGRSKISNIIIDQIKIDYNNGIKRKDLSIKYKISYSHIVSIIANKRR